MQETDVITDLTGRTTLSTRNYERWAKMASNSTVAHHVSHSITLITVKFTEDSDQVKIKHII